MSISQPDSVVSKSKGISSVVNDVVESARLLREVIDNSNSGTNVLPVVLERLSQLVARIPPDAVFSYADSLLSTSASVWNSVQTIRSLSRNQSQLVRLEHIACDLMRVAAFAFDDFGVDKFVDIIAKYAAVGNEFMSSWDFKLADICFRKAGDILRSLPPQDSPPQVARFLLSYARFLWTMKTIPRAERLLIKAQQYTSDPESAAELLSIMFKLGCVRFNERKAERAIFWFSKVIELGKLCPMKEMEVNAALLIGLCHLMLGQQHQARNSILQAQGTQSHPIARFLLLHIAVAEEEAGIERRIRTICNDETCDVSLCLASIGLVADKELIHESSVGYSLLCQSSKCDSDVVLLQVGSLYLQNLDLSGRMMNGVQLIKDVFERMENSVLGQVVFDSYKDSNSTAVNHHAQWYKKVVLFACNLVEKKMYAAATNVFRKALHFAQSNNYQFSFENEAQVCRLLATCAFNCIRVQEEKGNETMDSGSSISRSDFIEVVKTNAARACVLIPDDPTVRLLLFHSFLLGGKSEMAVVQLEKAVHENRSIDAYDITDSDYCKNDSSSGTAHIEALEYVLKKTCSNLRSSNPTPGLFGACLVSVVKTVARDAEDNGLSASELMRLHALLGSALETINAFNIELAFGTDEVKKNEALGFLAKVAWNCAISTMNRKMYTMAETFSQMSFDLIEQVGLNTDHIESMRTMRMVQAAALIERESPEQADYTRAQKCLKDACSLSIKLVEEGDPAAQAILLMNARCCAALGEDDGLRYYVNQAIQDPSNYVRVLQPLVLILIPDGAASVSEQRKEVAKSLLRSIINHCSSQNDRNVHQLAIYHRQLATLELSNIHENDGTSFARALKFAKENIELYPVDERQRLASTARNRADVLMVNNSLVQAKWWMEAAIEMASVDEQLLQYVTEMKAVLEKIVQRIEASPSSVNDDK